MGCHTWFYKKIEPQPTRDDKISAFVKRRKNFRDKCVKALENKGFQYQDEKSWYPFYSELEVLERINLIDWQLENVDHYDDYKFDVDTLTDEQNLTKEQELYCDVESYGYNAFSTNTTEHKGIYYEEVDHYFDAFRFHDYGRVLESKSETYKLLENENCKKWDDTYNLIDEFWQKYPDGIIELG